MGKIVLVRAGMRGTGADLAPEVLPVLDALRGTLEKEGFSPRCKLSASDSASIETVITVTKTASRMWIRGQLNGRERPFNRPADMLPLRTVSEEILREVENGNVLVVAPDWVPYVLSLMLLEKLGGEQPDWAAIPDNYDVFLDYGHGLLITGHECRLLQPVGSA